MAFEIARIHERLEAEGLCFDGLDLSFSSSPASSSLVESSPEGESSEDDEFVAGLAEQMARSMLEDLGDELTNPSCIGMSSQGVDRSAIWQISQTPEVDWSAKTHLSNPGGGLFSESRSPPLNAFPVERGTRPWDGLASPSRERSGLWIGGVNPAHRHLDHQIERKMQSVFDFSWQWEAGATQLPLMHSFLAQSNSSLPLCSPANLEARINEPKSFHHLQKQLDLDEEVSRKFAYNQGGQATRARNAWPHSNPNHMENAPQATHAKGGLQHRSSNAASHGHLVHPNGSGSGMRAVFLGGKGAPKESSGTGVFFPLSSRYQKKKSVFSTVLLPSRVVEVLNLQLDDLGRQPSGQTHSAFSASSQLSRSNNERTKAHLKSENLSNRAFGGHEEWRRSLSTCSQLHQASRLPSDWAY